MVSNFEIKTYLSLINYWQPILDPDRHANILGWFLEISLHMIVFQFLATMTLTDMHEINIPGWFLETSLQIIGPWKPILDKHAWNESTFLAGFLKFHCGLSESFSSNSSWRRCHWDACRSISWTLTSIHLPLWPLQNHLPSLLHCEPSKCIAVG